MDWRLTVDERVLRGEYQYHYYGNSVAVSRNGLAVAVYEPASAAHNLGSLSFSRGRDGVCRRPRRPALPAAGRPSPPPPPSPQPSPPLALRAGEKLMPEHHYEQFGSDGAEPTASG